MAIDMLKALGVFTLDEVDPPRGQSPTEFTAYATKAPIVVAGYGGWSRIAMPRRKAQTEWVGRDSISVQIDFLVDNLEEGEGLFTETSIRYLEHLAGVESDDPEPPLFQLKSNPEPLMPHGYYRASHVKWFVESITWDADSIIYNSAGNRVRAGGTLVVTQFVQDERLQAISVIQKGKKSNPTKGSKRKTYTVKAGDTLTKIAARKDIYGDASKWKKIAEANGIRDPKSIKVGQKLKIP